MCVAVYKPAGVEFPSWRKLEKCFKKNPDGAGFMWIENETVHTLKGFMKWEDFKKALKPFKNDSKYKEIDFGLHFRISTQGGVNAGATHPFILSEKVETLQTTAGAGEVACIHNGIIPLTTNYISKSNLSDTMLFVKDYLTQIAPKQEDYKNPYKMDIVEEIINSKMLIFCGNGTINILGKGWNEVEGVYYSNLYWQDIPSKGGAKKTKYFPKYNKFDSYYNGWEDVWYNEKNKECYKDTCLYELTGDYNDCHNCTLETCLYWDYKKYI